MIKSGENSIGAKGFLIGIIFALLVGLSASIFPNMLSKYSSFIYLMLVALGIIVGFTINTNERDSQTFLTVGVIIVIISKFGIEGVISSLIGMGVERVVSNTFAALLDLFVPATIVVAIKTVLKLTRV